MSAPVRSEWRTSARALVWADAKSTYNGLRKVWPMTAFGVVLLGAMAWTLSRFVTIVPVTAGQVDALRDALAVLIGLAVLGGFSGVRLTSVAAPLLPTLPLDKRAVWALVAARVSMGAFIPPATAAVVLALAPGGGHHAAVEGIVVLAAGLSIVVFAVLGASYLSLRTAGGPRAVRWALWGAFVLFALAPPVAIAVTGDTGISIPWTGPFLAAANVAKEAGDYGLIGALIAAVASLGAGWLLAHAPPGSRATAPLDDAGGEGVRTPWPEPADSPAPAVSFEIAGPLTTEGELAARARNLEAMRGKRAASDDDPEQEPLPVPFGLEPALKYHAGLRPIPVKDALTVLVASVVILAFVYLVFARPLNLPPAPVVGRPDPVQLFAGLWATIVLLAAITNAPGARSLFKAMAQKDKEKREAKAKKQPTKKKIRQRPFPGSIRRWAIMQTMPIDRTLMARVYFEGRLAGAAVLAVICALPLAIFQPPLWVAGWILLVAMACMAGLSGAAVPLISDVPVTREGKRPWLWARRGGQGLWIFGGMLVPLAVLAQIGDPLFALQPTPRQAALYVLTACMAAAVPPLFYRTFFEELVESQRPYDTPKRVVPVVASGAAVFALLLALVAGL